MVLGAYHLRSGVADVKLDDATTEAVNLSRQVSADAVRFTHLATYLPDVRSGHHGWDTALHIRNDGAGPTDIVITLFNPVPQPTPCKPAEPKILTSMA